MDERRRLVVAMTGASGVIYGIRLMEALRPTPVETHLIVSRWAARTIHEETDWDPEEVRLLADFAYKDNDLLAPLASGSFRVAGMIVAPCSMKSLAAIATGVSENLIHRAADVTIKERRRLVLLTRESPLSLIHLRNMVAVVEAGATVVPPVPAFYGRPHSLEEVVDHTVGRLLDLFDIEHDLVRRWGERRLRRASEPRLSPGR